MSGNAEALVILGDAAHGLLARMGHVKRRLDAKATRPDALSSSTFGSVRSRIVKGFPDYNVEAVR